MILPKFTILFLSLFGIIFLGAIMHEGIHLVQAKEVYSICYDVNQKSFMHINGNFENKQYSSLELPAYIIQGLIILTLVMCLIVDFQLNRVKQKTL
jgi:hypothetical protein